MEETHEQHLSKPAGTPLAAVSSSVTTDAEPHRFEQTNAAAQPATDKPAGEHVATVTTPATTEADNFRPEQTDAALRSVTINPVAAPTPATTRVADGAPFTPPATGKKDVNMPAANSDPSAISVLTQRPRSMSPPDEHVRRRTSTGHATGSSLSGRDGARISSTNTQLQVAEMDLIIARADRRPLKGKKDHVEPADSGAATGSISSNKPNSNLDYMRRQAWAALKGRSITYKASNKEVQEIVSGEAKCVNDQVQPGSHPLHPGYLEHALPRGCWIPEEFQDRAKNLIDLSKKLEHKTDDHIIQSVAHFVTARNTLMEELPAQLGSVDAQPARPGQPLFPAMALRILRWLSAIFTIV